VLLKAGLPRATCKSEETSKQASKQAALSRVQGERSGACVAWGLRSGCFSRLDCHAPPAGSKQAVFMRGSQSASSACVAGDLHCGCSSRLDCHAPPEAGKAAR
jgi:hypothetical protein